jgi:uncharacterized protein (TIGR03000 family)
MNRQNWKRWLIGGVAVALLLSAAPKADARCWGCGGYYGGWGGYYAGWGGYYSGWANYIGLGVRYGGCYDCRWNSYYPPYYLGYRSPYCGCYSSWGYDGCAPAAPATSPIPASAPSMPSGPGPFPKSTGASTENTGLLTVSVPYDAKVTINGRETGSTGSRRQYVSNGLQPGLTYKYVVHAEVVRDGQVQEDTQTVTLTVGQTTAVAFGFNATPLQVATTP